MLLPEFAQVRMEPLPPSTPPPLSHQRKDAAVGIVVALVVNVHWGMLLVVVGGVLRRVRHRLIHLWVVLPMVLNGVIHMVVVVIHKVTAGGGGTGPHGRHMSGTGAALVCSHMGEEGPHGRPGCCTQHACM
jgi:hypothetical protein